MNGDWGTEAKAQVYASENATSEREYNAIDHIDAEIARLQKLVSLLAERLMPVTKLDQEVSAENPTPMPRSPLVERAQSIAEVCSKIDRLVMRLDI